MKGTPDRVEIASRLQGESLVRKGLMARTGGVDRIRITHGLNVIKLGGHGAIDYGSAVMHPLSAELGELSRTDQLLVVTGGGARVRHIMDVGLDLGMPTGVLAGLSAKVSEQNAIMDALLLAPWGGDEDPPGRPARAADPATARAAPGHPRHPAVRPLRAPGPDRRDPAAPDGHGGVSDSGGDGRPHLYPRQERRRALHGRPAQGPGRRADPEISAREVIAMDLDDLILERMVLERMLEAVHVREVRIVNCTVPGIVTRAVRGEDVGTVIRS